MIACFNCGRKFAGLDRLEVHQRSCLKNIQNESPVTPKKIRYPKTLICYICGRQFGTASLEIHQRTCKKMYEIEQQKLPPEQRTPLKKLMESPINTSMKSVEEYNEQAYQKYTENLVPCQNCGRKFAGHDRLAVHQKSCTPERPAKPVKQKI